MTGDLLRIEITVDVRNGGTSYSVSREASAPARRRREYRVTDERLRDFATAYTERYHPGGWAAFADSLSISERQMWRLLKLARERGFIPTTRSNPNPGDTP